MPTFATPEPITAALETVTGRVLVRASDRADTVVQVRPADPAEDADVKAAEETRVEYADGHLSVRSPKYALRSLFGRYPSVDMTIELPAGSSVDARGNAEFRSEGRLGESSFAIGGGAVRLDRTGRLKIRTGAGDVTLGRADGPVEVTTAAGRVRIGAVDGTAVVKTSSGDITVGEITGDARLNTAHGDVTVERALAALVARTAFGGVRVGEAVRGAIVLETRFGEIEIGVAAGVPAWLDVASKHGLVRSDLAPADRPDPSAADLEPVEVRANTGYGDIVIHRA
ncbi:DUF4097 family beta strand repeat-containing protein [Actinomadura rayongensis]|uniref:DUF4097 family beta strand repeat protein n=1 Tax=Actinomadura rayongensis TaxID=1429076 RepID=A0A6I4WCM2_9ACTN|nr:DUF4097 family beta strand repeat-containing protein [Actinomadura rayongensis]MXQ66863.1 DUF4097 family beta strand repeat protein [Actinomadura rayongensis]